MIDLEYFWMVGAPRDSNCVLDCVDLEMGGLEHFDVSSIPPISSDSIKARFSLIKVGHSHFFAGN